MNRSTVCFGEFSKVGGGFLLAFCSGIPALGSSFCPPSAVLSSRRSPKLTPSIKTVFGTPFSSIKIVFSHTFTILYGPTAYCISLLYIDSTTLLAPYSHVWLREVGSPRLCLLQKWQLPPEGSFITVLLPLLFYSQ